MQTDAQVLETTKSLPPGVHVPAQGGWLKPFQKGQSGNPGGKSKAQAECLALAREKSVEAMQRLTELVHDPDPRVALIASDKVLERAWGKPKEQKDEPKPALDLSKAPPEALQLIRQALAMIAMAAPATRSEVPDAVIVPNEERTP